LTSKFFDIWILQTLFAEPAPSRAFKGVGEGGTPEFLPSFPNRKMADQIYFVKKSTANGAKQASAAESKWPLLRTKRMILPVVNSHKFRRCL